MKNIKINSFYNLIQNASRQLEGISDSPLLDAELLLCRHLGQPRTYLRTWPEKEVSENVLRYFHHDLERRLKGEPIAYILGYQEFWGIQLKVSPAVLIPRPDTETLIEAVLDECVEERLSVLDLGTGSGTIAVALASEHAYWKIAAIDASASALEVAQENLAPYLNVTCLKSNWYDALTKEKQLDIIVSNPPYIDASDPHLCKQVKQYEPESALISSKNGLEDIEYIIKHAKDYLKAGGKVFLEHGFQQAKAVKNLFEMSGFQDVQHRNDLSGHVRVTYATLP